MPKMALIVGAGPAGLTAALELARRSDIQPIVLEADDIVGGISRTVQYKGNRMDMGGHRFFSKSDRVMQWWLDLMPLEKGAAGAVISYQNKQRTVAPSPLDSCVDPSQNDLVMLLRSRKSRIYFQRKFFDYPVQLTPDTLRKLGLARSLRIGVSYLNSRINPRRPERSLEDFLINRFGDYLYRTFFQSYTEKVWGVPCSAIGAEWGAQRIKGLSLTRALAHFIRKAWQSGTNDLRQKQTETSLIEQFLYPKLGPGQLWEHVAAIISRQGGQVLLGWRAVRINVRGWRVVSVEAENAAEGRRTFNLDYVFSTMPVRDLIRALSTDVPSEVRAVSEGLQYRDFIAVGLLVNRLAVYDKNGGPLKDNWVYIQEPDVMLGRLQFFHNWSPYMVRDPRKNWIGLEYFCNDTDDLWKMQDAEMMEFAVGELVKIGIVRRDEVLDGCVVHIPKAYPAYFGSYNRFGLICNYTDRFENLFLVGRNGMHKYNNQDHSMLTAMAAVDNILGGVTTKANLWDINTEQEYHEIRKDG
jgi:protoporphyrinogen oxidase